MKKSLKQLWRELFGNYRREPEKIESFREKAEKIESGFTKLPSLSDGIRVPEGYTRIAGYERFDGNSKPTPVVPGVGPILDCGVKNGVTFAIRSDGTQDVCYVWNTKNREWVKQ